MYKNGWHVIISPYYLDQNLNKAREIDLVAEKSWLIPDKFEFDIKTGTIAVRLFIECKYVASHSVFWFADKDKESAQNLIYSYDIFQTDHDKYINDHR